MVKVGPKDETQLTTTQRVINKSLWLIGTSRNAILVIVCGYIGYHFEDTGAIKLTGEYNINVICIL
jgi:sodium-independent sulfate anion transporter 11